MPGTFQRRILIPLLLLAMLPFSQAAAQDTTNYVRSLESERSLIQSALGAMVGVIRTATVDDGSNPVGDRIKMVTAQLNAVSQSLATPPMTTMAPSDPAPPSSQYISLDELRELEQDLNALYQEVRELRLNLQVEEQFELADRLGIVESGLDQAVVKTRRLIEIPEGEDVGVGENDPEADRYLRPGTYTADDTGEEDHNHREYEDNVTVTDIAREIETATEEASHAHRSVTYSRIDTRRGKRSDSPFDYGHDEFNAFVGEFYNKWPFRETAQYRPVPAFRYNRVEGLVLGARMLPLEWGDWEHAKVYGQAAYSFGLKDLRYEIGVEVRPIPDLSDDFDFKVGGSYRQNTGTNDIWKVSYVENTIAALFFEHDYLDYFETQGFHVYAVQRLSPYAQFSVGYRSDDFTSLGNNATWSLFRAGDFRPNPFVDELQLNALVLTLEGGQLRHRYNELRGSAFRFEAELGENFGGDRAYTRYLGDIRTYTPIGNTAYLGIRVRGGIASDDAPYQKQFTLGGVGSLRGYAQNGFIGTKALLANVEYGINNLFPFDDIFDDFLIYGFADAGWVNGPLNNSFDSDDIFPSAGVGMSFGHEAVRIELAWPMKEAYLGDPKDPSLWIRLTPMF